ncbi:Arginase/deacetylase [Dendrothele bispora CBS 962.96]|uniref:Arginase/deacetylase n=1 Tax=Dendrothele bispora (strain CBS 962.96) TaxID=1314807 RepID=A0A4S8KPI9_DENBC|nr:Arginase/deacetylase [Dendrothele bispora CBS 962.96]
MLCALSRHLAFLALSILSALSPSSAHSHHNNVHIQRSFRTCRHLPRTQVLEVRSPVDLGFSGPLSFSHLDYRRCLEDTSMPFDIGIVGFPFDTKTGARFGASAIRSSSQRQISAWSSSTYAQGPNVLECGDVPPRPYNNSKALDQMAVAYDMLLFRPVSVYSGADDEEHTWPPMGMTAQESINYGSFFAVAAEEGFLTNMSMHAGISMHVWNLIPQGFDDTQHNSTVGFSVITTDDIDDYGVKKVVEKMRQGLSRYLSLDIDVIAGMSEIGGWTTQEVKTDST